jgi:Holliday junction resolvase RusA-like endonuclease
VIEFIVEGLPQSKGSWRAIPGMGRLIPDNPKEGAWAALVGWHAKMAMMRTPTRAPTMITGFAAVALEFTLPPKKGRKNQRDIDKLVRSVLDALTGIVYVDDEQVVRLEASKITAERGHGVRVRVNPWEPSTGAT